MKPFKFAELPSHSAVAATVTTLVSAWFVVAGATMLASPTDNEVARGASVTVKPVSGQPAAQPVAAADAHFTIVVEARRA